MAPQESRVGGLGYRTLMVNADASVGHKEASRVGGQKCTELLGAGWEKWALSLQSLSTVTSGAKRAPQLSEQAQVAPFRMLKRFFTSGKKKCQFSINPHEFVIQMGDMKRNSRTPTLKHTSKLCKNPIPNT